VQSVIWLFIPLLVIFCFCIFYKVGYDQRETSQEVTDWFQWIQVAGGIEFPFPHPDRMSIVNQILPGIVLAFFQVCVLAAIAVAIATRLPMVVNLVASFAVFVIGNLTPVMVAQGDRVIQNEFVTFTARLIATILPSLEAFNISAAVATGRDVPPSYLGECLLYGMAYSTAVILVAFILFEDRDLA
jgi:hypothetical protein